MAEVQRVAILGGGMASLATALELTSEPDWASRYEVTVYQMGWRLGGKGASSRNPDAADRIEEHGLHVWFGCYDHAFHLLRGCYDELDRPVGSPFATVDDAFTPKNDTPYFELVDGKWTLWPMWFPPTPGRPGTGDPQRSTWDYLVMAMEALAHAERKLLGRHGEPGPLRQVRGGRRRPVARHHHRLLTLAHRLARHGPRRRNRGLLWLLGRARTWVFTHLEEAAASSTAIRRGLVELDLVLTMLLGCLRDGVAADGFDVIDDEDLRDWLRRHGAAPGTIESTPVRALYDLYFAYAGGDLANPSFAAGVAINAVLRLALGYKGAVANEMRAGMGEVVIAPIYETLAARGVAFAFFHRVERLELDADRTRLERIHLARQVDLVDGTDTGYHPLTPPIRGIRCWPALPLTDQIQDGHRLAGYDLESRWSGWTDVGHRTLQVGEDFDVAVLGISLAGLPDVAADLGDDERWRELFDDMGTTQTQSAQLWMDASLEEMGWTAGALPTDAGPEPLDVWADRTEILQFETWPDPAPRSLQYLCGPLPGESYRRPPTDPDVPGEALQQVVATLTAWLEEGAVALWPGTRAPGGGFDWQRLHAPASTTGRERLASQFLRANIDPSERYVLSLPGTARLRPAADGSGYPNLVLAGDWTRTEWNVGCIEAAAISGLNAARVITARRPTSG